MSQKFHEHKDNKGINYAGLISPLCKQLYMYDKFDLSVGRHLSTDGSEHIFLEVDCKLFRNGERGYIILEEYEVGRWMRSYYYDNMLYRVSITSRSNSVPVFQMNVGTRSVQINEVWYDLSTFREKAFFVDTSMELPFELGELAQCLFSLGIIKEDKQ